MLTVRDIPSLVKLGYSPHFEDLFKISGYLCSRVDNFITISTRGQAAQTENVSSSNDRKYEPDWSENCSKFPIQIARFLPEFRVGNSCSEWRTIQHKYEYTTP